METELLRKVCHIEFVSYILLLLKHEKSKYERGLVSTYVDLSIPGIWITKNCLTMIFSMTKNKLISIRSVMASKIGS